MSGKAPPRGPRALLGQSQAQPQQPPDGPPTKRIGAVPPTGPRSLTNGFTSAKSRTSLVNGRKPQTNGFSPSPSPPPPPPPDEPPPPPPPPPPPTEHIPGPSSRPAIAFSIPKSKVFTPRAVASKARAEPAPPSAPPPASPPPPPPPPDDAPPPLPPPPDVGPPPPEHAPPPLPPQDDAPPPPPDDAPPPLPPPPIHIPYTIHVNMKKPEVKTASSVFSIKPFSIPHTAAAKPPPTPQTKPPEPSIPPPSLPPPPVPKPPPIHPLPPRPQQPVASTSRAPPPPPPPASLPPFPPNLPPPPTTLPPALPPPQPIFSSPPSPPPPPPPSLPPPPIPGTRAPTPPPEPAPASPIAVDVPVVEAPKPPPPEPKPKPKSPTPPPPPPRLPAWPPPRAELPSARSHKVLYDPALDVKDPGGKEPAGQQVQNGHPAAHWRALIARVRERGSPAVVAERIRGKVGKEMLVRVEGEVLLPAEGEGENKSAEGDTVEEEEVAVRDPRLAPGFKPPKSPRTEFALVAYEHDVNAVSPPPTTVLLTGFAPLTPNALLQAHLAAHGPVAHLHRQMDSATGAALGVAVVRFASAEDARRCMEREDGARGPIAGAGSAAASGGTGGEERRAVLDPEGGVLKALLKEMDERRKREREERRRREREREVKEKEAKEREGKQAQAGPSTSGTPRAHPSLPLNPKLNANAAAGPSGSPKVASPGEPRGNSRYPALGKAQHAPVQGGGRVRHGRGNGFVLSGANAILPGSSTSAGAGAGGDAGGRGGAASGGRRRWNLPPRPANSYRPRVSRSPSPDTGLLEAATRAQHEAHGRNRWGRDGWGPESAMGRGKGKGRERDERARAEARAALAANGRDHLKLKVEFLGAVRDEDVREFMKAFAVDKIVRDDEGIYVTFTDGGTARRAERVLGGGAAMLGFHAVTLSVHPAPAAAAAAGPVVWDDKTLVEKAQEMVERELREFLEKDITDRIVGPHLRRLAAERRNRPLREGEVREGGEGERPVAVKRDLKTMSFKKAKKEVEIEVPPEEHEEERGEEQVVVERPKKKRKKETPKKQPKKVLEEDIESEDEAESGEVWAGQKRAVSEEEEEQPSRKKVKLDQHDLGVKKGSKKKKVPEKKRKASVEEVVLPDEYDTPAVADLRLSPGPESSLSPSRSPSPSPPAPRLPTPPPNVLDEGICEDDEDIYYAKLVLSGRDIEPSLDPAPLPTSETAPFFRKHITGSARTEGFYKITHAEKIAYVTQYQARATNVATAAPVDEPPLQHVESSRSNRANARRRAQGLEEINQVQRAVALSKGEAAANELSFKFNQLQTRKKHLRFARSPIHDWGLYAMEKISRGEMVIEYVGEVIRAQVAEKREKAYERQGIGSSYLFRIDEDLVVDATKKGNLGRLINHSCDPNCTAKIITINGEKKIVIYAKQEIELGDEITYDYHFPFEQDKIPCLCGSAKCRGFLN